MKFDYPYVLSKLTEDQWGFIIENKKKMLVYDSSYTTEDLNRWPGFTISEGDDPGYFKSYYKRNLSKVFTPPRGNISSSFHSRGVPVVVCGIAPGESKISRGEPKWLLGPSSKILHGMMNRLNIYPYYTNIFKQPIPGNANPGYSEDLYREPFFNLYEELTCLHESTWKKFPGIVIVFLGKYDAYSRFMSAFVCDTIITVNIYHPSYYARKNLGPQSKEAQSDMAKIERAIKEAKE